MNNSNPFVPQGSLLEQKNKKRARVKVAVYSIFALNILVISPLLIQGCSKKDASVDLNNAASTQPADNSSTSTASTTPAPSATDTNMPPTLPPPPVSDTNPAVANNTPVPPVAPPVVTPPAPVPDAAPAGKDYVVAKGDSFYSIAKKFGVKIKEIEAANPGVVPAKLKVGQKLQIPAGGSTSGGAAAADAGSENVYVVKAGDSLTKIAKTHGTTIKAIRAANGMRTDKIKVGMKLKLPTKAAPAADTASAPVTTTANMAPAPAVQPIPSAPAADAAGTPVHQ